MRKPAKIVVVGQHYLPDRSTTAAITFAIAGHLATEAPVLELSGTRGPRREPLSSGEPTVVEIKNRCRARLRFSSMELDISKTLSTGWRPQISLDGNDFASKRLQLGTSP
jgi:hypothetical protein